MGSRQRRKIRNYLVNRRVQLTLTAIMVLMSSLLTALLGFFWYNEIRIASEVIRINAIATLGPEAAAVLGAELAAADQHRLILLASFAVLLGLLITAYGIVTTHRIAGPLFKISKHMEDIAADRLYGLWGLRRSDQLQEFFTTFEGMHNALRSRARDDVLLLTEVIAAAETGGSMEDQLPALREALEAKTCSMRDASETTQKIKTAEA